MRVAKRRLLVLLAALGVLASVGLSVEAQPAQALADDYPWRSTTYSMNDISPLRFFYRNCTDFAAFRLNKQLGGSTSPASAQRFNWSILTSDNGGKGNAADWKKAVIAKWGAGRVDTTPAVGSVAWWAYGHVAIVSAVFADGSVQVEEYNYENKGAYGVRPSGKNSQAVRADAYLHIADVASPAASPVAKYAGHIVQWKGDTKAQKTAWYVTSDLRRLWIPDSATYYALKAIGAKGPDVLGSSVLDQLPDQTGRWAAAGNGMTADRTLRRGMYLRSSDQRYLFVLQEDGNLVLYGPSGKALWANNRFDTAFVVFQGDGNLVSYRSDGSANWSSKTNGRGGTRLVVQNDGNVVIYTSSRVPVWATNTAGRK